jgi:hypothetical protein
MTANELTQSVIGYCNKAGHFVFRQNNIPTRRRANTTHKGVADVMGCTKKGTALAIEIKVGRDQQSEDQKIFQENFEKRNGIYILARKLEDVTERI